MSINKPNWINKPYPFISQIRDQLLVSSAFGVFVFLFLLVFQPFGLGDMDTNKSAHVFLFGLITSLVMLFNYLVWPRIFPRFFNPDEWVVWQEILFGLWNILLIALCNYLYNSWVQATLLDPGMILSFIVVTLSLGIFPLTVMVLVNELYLSDKHQKEANLMSHHFELEGQANSIEIAQNSVTIGESKMDSLELHENDLLYIQARDNYCLVHYQENNQVSSKLIRTTLKGIEIQLEGSIRIVRCHRSFLVNRQKINMITGNARSYTIHLDGCTEKIPVSRGIKKDTLLG